MRGKVLLIVALGCLTVPAFLTGGNQAGEPTNSVEKKNDPHALMKMMDGYRNTLPPPQGINEENGLGVQEKDGEVHPDSHLWGIATRMKVRSKADCMILLTYLKDPKVKIRHIAAFAIENVVKAYPDGFPAGSLDDLESEQHQKMVLAFVERIEMLK